MIQNNYELMLEILQNHDIQYRMLNTKGLISYDNKIYINPMFNEDAQTLYHEMLHYWSDIIENQNLPEDEIERLTQEGFEKNKGLERFLTEYLEKYAKGFSGNENLFE